jgi:hypothetical protein
MRTYVVVAILLAGMVAAQAAVAGSAATLTIEGVRGQSVDVYDPATMTVVDTVPKERFDATVVLQEDRMLYQVRNHDDLIWVDPEQLRVRRIGGPRRSCPADILGPRTKSTGPRGVAQGCEP